MYTASEKERGAGVPFERIRRITGYLVGDMRYWNNGKKAEESDRVKHEAEVIDTKSKFMFRG